MPRSSLRLIIGERMRIRPIGVVHTPFKCKEDAPVLSWRSKTVCRVEVFEKYKEGLADIDGFSHIFLVYRFHRSRGFHLKVRPLLGGPDRGLFATRYPRRPNQIGVTVVRLVKRRGRTLFVKGVDIVDGAPLLDIKPYVPDAFPKGAVRIGWLEDRLPPHNN